MMDNQIRKKNLHFLVFPWLAQGHINPFLQLSKALAMHGHTVSFLSTPVNISRIRPSLQLQDCPGRIDLLELPLPPTEGLTPGAECTADIPIEMAFALQKAIDGLEKPFGSLLRQLSPDYVVHDFAQYWAQNVAAAMRVPSVYFTVYSPAICGHSLLPSRLLNQEITAEEVAAPPPGFPCSAISFRPYEARDIIGMYAGIPGTVTAPYRLAKCVQGCVAVAVKSCFEEDDKYIRYYKETIGVPVLSVGPLMPVSKPGPDNREGSDLLDWLDRQRPSSVVFVSFGSETFLSREQAHELALGLEASGLPFLCSLRVPHFLDNAPEYALELLPEGFETRTQDQGLVVWGWVPQVRIVSHPSVGAYLSHSGWSSAMEALTFGVPLVLLPVKLDQSLNARQLASELKLGIEVGRGDDGSFLSENIAAALRMVMAGEEGKKLRSKVAEARDIIVANSGRQQDYIHEFIKQLEQIAVAYTQI